LLKSVRNDPWISLLRANARTNVINS
jgi:hypothetical protein